jgi:hypothetical protein
MKVRIIATLSASESELPDFSPRAFAQNFHRLRIVVFDKQVSSFFNGIGI